MSNWPINQQIASWTRSRSTRTGSSAPPPNPFAWIAFGGGMNRCIGAAFATMEMDVALRTLLREFRFAPTEVPG